MSAPQPSPSKVENWRELYTAALSESDRDRVPKRIADAEQAIVVRARQLFLTGSDTIEEDQALDDALYVADIRWAGASPAENACAAGIRLLRSGCPSRAGTAS